MSTSPFYQDLLKAFPQWQIETLGAVAIIIFCLVLIMLLSHPVKDKSIFKKINHIASFSSIYCIILFVFLGFSFLLSPLVGLTKALLFWPIMSVVTVAMLVFCFGLKELACRKWSKNGPWFRTIICLVLMIGLTVLGCQFYAKLNDNTPASGAIKPIAGIFSPRSDYAF